MKYSIFSSTRYMLDAFESIDKIEIYLDRNNRLATIYLNNNYCDYNVTIKDIERLLRQEEHQCLVFVK